MGVRASRTANDADPLGGTVTKPKTEIPGQGWYAVAHDAEGNEIELCEWLPRSG